MSINTPRSSTGYFSVFQLRPFRLPAAALALAVALLALPLSPLSTAWAAEPPVVVNINTADAATLASALQGVGESRAQEIVRYRETYGPFVSIDELADVKGIGTATVERNRPHITLE